MRLSAKYRKLYSLVRKTFKVDVLNLSLHYKCYVILFRHYNLMSLPNRSNITISKYPNFALILLMYCTTVHISIITILHSLYISCKKKLSVFLSLLLLKSLTIIITLHLCKMLY